MIRKLKEPYNLKASSSCCHPTSDLPVGMPSLWILWLFGFAYALVMALILQKLVMPIMPSLHAGHGLMNQDAIVFHQIAAEMADRINVSGWSEWRLMPGGGTTANVGILAAVYAVFGADPVWFIPLNAGFHALGALLVLRLGLHLMPGRGGLIAGSFAAVLFLVFPSALVWYGQNHKDAFLITGFLLILFVLIKAEANQALFEILKNLVFMVSGCVIVVIMRPHMLMVYATAIATSCFIIVSIKLIRRTDTRMPVIRNVILMLGVMVAVQLAVSTKLGIASKASSIITMSSHYGETVRDLGWRWENSGALPDFIESKLEQISFVRVYFINSGRLVDAGSTIDETISPINAWEMFAYLPRALLVGLFAPFPDAWLERPTLPRLIGAIETLIFYLVVPGVLIMVWKMPSQSLFVCLAVAAIVLTVLSYTSPNIGTLHRIRYGPIFVFMLIGASGWFYIFHRMSDYLRLNWGRSYPSQKCNPSNDKNSRAVIGRDVKTKRMISTGALFAMVSLIGALGLLIRDLVLINRSDFGASLDSFYLVMMVPMLFVSILTLPLGDTLTATLFRKKTRSSVQELTSTTLTVSMLTLGILCLILFITAGPIYRNFVVDGEIARVLRVLPLALSVLFFSGPVVVANSLLNSLGKPILAASAQLCVPVTAIVATLFASRDNLIMSAVAGTVIGQLLNLAVLFFLCFRLGYRLIPAPVTKMDAEGRMLRNYGWLAAAAMISALASPITYWLAAQLGDGAVCIWAVGNKLVQMVMALGVAMASAVAVPYLSKLVASGLHVQIGRVAFLSAIVGGWVGSILSLAIFAFASPMIAAVTSDLHNEEHVDQLIGVVQIGVLQLPYFISSVVLIKLLAVSEVSRRLMAIAGSGLSVTFVLGYVWLPIMGLHGIVVASSIAVLLTSTMIIFVARAQSHLTWKELACILAGWTVPGLFSLSIYIVSLSAAALGILILFLVLAVQIKTLIGASVTHKNLP